MHRRHPAAAGSADETGEEADRLEVADIEDTDHVEDTDQEEDTDQSDDPDVFDDDLHVANGGPVQNASRPGSLGSLLRGSGSQKRSGTAVYDDMPTTELTTLMRKLDDKERLLRCWRRRSALCSRVVLTIITVHNDPVGKGHESTSEIVSYGRRQRRVRYLPLRDGLVPPALAHSVRTPVPRVQPRACRYRDPVPLLRRLPAVQGMADTEGAHIARREPQGAGRRPARRQNAGRREHDQQPAA